MRAALLTLFLAISQYGCFDGEQSSRSQFEETLVLLGTQTASKLIVDANGVFIIGTSTDATGSAMLLIHTDLDGGLRYTRTYADDAFGEGSGIVRTNDGGFLLIGSHRVGNVKNMLVVRTDEEGFSIAEHSIGGPLNDIGRHIVELPAGGMVVLGTSSSSGPGVAGMYVARLDAGGTLLWSRGMGGVSVDGGSELLVIDGYHLMLLGFTESLGPGQRDLWLQMVSLEGDSLWSSFYGGPAYEESQAIVQTADGGYVLCGHSSSLHPIHALHALRLDVSGNVLWERHFGSAHLHEGGESVAIDFHGNMVFVGRGDGADVGEEIFVVVTDQDGNIISEERTGGMGDQWATDIKCVESGCYILANTLVAGTGNIMLLKRQTPI